MANQNLSQFTEKLFVADADHTFIWDTAASISKRVSRNSWLNSGTLTSDAPVTISQTWNGTGSTVFTALKVNATTPGTTSSSSSLLLDLQVGGVSQFSIQRNGTLRMPSADPETKLSYSAAGFLFYGSGSPSLFIGQDGTGNGNAVMGNTGFIGFASAFTAASGNADTRLYRDSANTLALRNGANAQTFNIYNTYQNAGVDYERITFKWSANLFTIGREFGGTGGARSIRVIGGGSVVGIGEAASAAVDWTFSSGSLLAGTDNSRDIGASGANRPRNVYAANGFISASTVDAPYIRAGSSGGLQMQGRFFISSTVDGNIYLTNNAINDFGRLQFGGTTNLFPAIKRSSTTLQARLADDSAFAPIQGKLTTDTAYTATVVAATGYITIYDSTGAAYRVPCAV